MNGSSMLARTRTEKGRIMARVIRAVATVLYDKSLSFGGATRVLSCHYVLTLSHTVAASCYHVAIIGNTHMATTSCFFTREK
jgi:hypothetical protein